MNSVLQISIGDQVVDLAQELLIDARGTSIRLRPRAWGVLRFLALHRGRLVSKDELMNEVWPDCVVTDDSLVQAIGDIRRALGDSNRQALRTLPRRGYLLVAKEAPGDEQRVHRVPDDAPEPPEVARLGDRLRAEAARRFVGRATVLALLRSSLSPGTARDGIFFIHGPGGIGKSTVLEQFRAQAQAGGLACVRLDGASLPLTPLGIVAALSSALNLVPSVQTLNGLAHAWPRGGRTVLMVDAFDALQPVVGWLLDSFLPSLPEQTVIVLAARQAPDTHLTAHPLWGESLRCIGLDSLSREEATGLLVAHGVPEAVHARVLDLCHGYPLALVLLAADVRRHGRIPSGLGVGLVQALTRRCVAHAPTASHRLALQACALARTTTLALLCDVVGAAEAPAVFDWLAEQSFVRVGLHGLMPHDLVRDAIDAQARWRDPPASRALQHVVSRHLIGRLQQGNDAAHIVFELEFLERHSALMRRFFNFSLIGTIPVCPARAADGGAIDRLRDAGLPPAERRVFDHWRHHEESRVWVARHLGGEICGVTVIVRLDRLDDRTAGQDPLVTAARHALRDELTDLKQPGVSLMGRFTVPEGERRPLNPAMNALQLCHAMHWANEPNLRLWVVAAHHPDRFAPLLEGTRFRRLLGCDLVIDGVPMGCFVHDWQAEPWTDWRDRLIDALEASPEI